MNPNHPTPTGRVTRTWGTEPSPRTSLALHGLARALVHALSQLSAPVDRALLVVALGHPEKPLRQATLWVGEQEVAHAFPPPRDLPYADLVTAQAAEDDAWWDHARVLVRLHSDGTGWTVGAELDHYGVDLIRLLDDAVFVHPLMWPTPVRGTWRDPNLGQAADE